MLQKHINTGYTRKKIKYCKAVYLYVSMESKSVLPLREYGGYYGIYLSPGLNWGKSKLKGNIFFTSMALFL